MCQVQWSSACEPSDRCFGRKFDAPGCSSPCFSHLRFSRSGSSSCSAPLQVALHRLEAKSKAVHAARVFARHNFRISLSPRESIINSATARNLTPAAAAAASTRYLLPAFGTLKTPLSPTIIKQLWARATFGLAESFSKRRRCALSPLSLLSVSFHWLLDGFWSWRAAAFRCCLASERRHCHRQHQAPQRPARRSRLSWLAASTAASFCFECLSPPQMRQQYKDPLYFFIFQVHCTLKKAFFGQWCVGSFKTHSFLFRSMNF